MPHPGHIDLTEHHCSYRYSRVKQVVRYSELSQIEPGHVVFAPTRSTYRVSNNKGGVPGVVGEATCATVLQGSTGEYGVCDSVGCCLSMIVHVIDSFEHWHGSPWQNPKA